MALHLNSVTVDALDPSAQARFWAEALGWHVGLADDDNQQAMLVPTRTPGPGDHAYPVLFWRVEAAKSSKNRWHFDLAPDDQEAEVVRLEGLGATLVDVGQADAGWTVMADPEGNEFCVLPSLPG